MMNLFRAHQIVAVAVICLMPISALADVIVRSSKVVLDANVSVDFIDGSSESSSSRVKTTSIEQGTSAIAEIDYIPFPNGDPSTATAATWYDVFSSANGASFELTAKTFTGFLPSNTNLKEGIATQLSLATAKIVFGVTGQDVLFDTLLTDFEGGPGTSATLLLRDLTTMQTILDLSLVDEDFSIATELDLNAGHTYKLVVTSLNTYTPGDEEMVAKWRFNNTNVTVPEPGTFALLGIGLAGMGLARRRRKA